MSSYRMTFEEAMTALDKFNKYHAARFGRVSRLNEKEDFQSIGHMIIWKCLGTYKFVCPICDKQFLTLEKYTNHYHNKRRVNIPKFSLKSYIKLRILSGFQAEIKREVAQKRAPKKPFVSTNDLEIGKRDSGIKIFELQDLVEYLLEDFDVIEKQIVLMLQSDYTTSEIILEMEDLGLKPNYVRGVLKKFRVSFKKFLMRVA